MSTLAFSVVVPTYQRSHLILRSIDSVLAQTHATLEVIVVDDASTDDTEAVVRAIADPRVRYIRLDHNSERGRARNVGTAAARGDYVCYLDSDDVYYPHHLATAEELIRGHQNPPWLHLGYELLGPDGEVQVVVDEPTGDVRTHLVRKGNCFSVSGVLLRGDIARAHPFNEDRRLAGFGEDYELWLRIAAHHAVLADPQVTSAVHHHDRRSMTTASSGELLQRGSAFLEYTLADPAITQAFGPHLARLEANVHYFVATRAAQLGASPSAVWRSLVAGVRADPSSVRTGWFVVATRGAVRRAFGRSRAVLDPRGVPARPRVAGVGASRSLPSPGV
ncbi:MAG: glycosyltransferase family 2 protein [Acidimicrobiales bacterium]